jgi:hypothetical protein
LTTLWLLVVAEVETIVAVVVALEDSVLEQD